MADEKDVKAPAGNPSEEFLEELRDAFAAWDGLSPEIREEMVADLCRTPFPTIDDPMVFDRRSDD